jgi:uncharacterized membrane protein
MHGFAPGRPPMLPFALLAAFLAADPPVAAAVAPPTAERVLGELVHARGQLAFAACGGDAAPAYGLRGGRDAAGIVARLNGGADGSVFIDADVAREADGRWRIERVRRAYRRGPRCTEDLGEFIWRGVALDGAWTLNVSRRYVALRRAGLAPLFVRYQPFQAGADGALVFSGRSGEVPLEVVMLPRRCEAGGGAAISDWSVAVVAAGQRSEGCAWGGEPR